MAEPIQLTEVERKALDLLLAVAREGAEDTSDASLLAPAGGRFIRGVVMRLPVRNVPVLKLVQTARLVAQVAGGGPAALTDTETGRTLRALQESSLDELL